MKKIYLDNAATTPVAKEVLEAMKPYFSEKYGNASSLHEFGRQAKEAIEKSREKIAKFINAQADEIIFTSGGTESDNLAIKGLASAYPQKRHIITSKIEHHAVLETCKEMQKHGYGVDYINVNKDGIISLDELRKKISSNSSEILVVSIMHVNNEVGIIQPIEEISKICRKNNVLFHTDAVQSFGKLKIDVKRQNIDLLSASAHKINGPKGIGILYARNGVYIKPLLNGGGHENGRRSGTENTAGIVGFSRVVELCEKNMKMKKSEKIRKLRDKLIKEILKIKGTKLNGSEKERIFNNVNVSFDGVEGESLVLLLDKNGIAASTGSACSSNSLKPSHVLKAIGLSDMQAHGSLRITLGWQNNEKEINYTIKKINENVKKLRELSGG